MTLPEIKDLKLLAREHGVRRVRVGDVEIELVPVSAAMSAAATARQPESLVPRCGCGHPKFDHRADIGCIHGCSPSRCIPNPPDLKE
jgi:hypothetical protein